MTGELADYKRENWKLKQELENYRQEHVRLNQRVREWFDWSQGVQNTLQEKDQQIDNLLQQVTTLENERRELTSRLNTAGVAMTENLYEQNKRLEIGLKESEDRRKDLEELVFRLLVAGRDFKLENAANVLQQSRQPGYRVFTYLFKQGKPVKKTSLQERLSLSSKSAGQALDGLLRARAIEEYAPGVYAIHGAVTDTVTGGGAVLPVATASGNAGGADIFPSTISKLRYSSSTADSLAILSKLKDYLTASGMSNLSFEIIQVMRDLQAGAINDDQLRDKIISWQQRHDVSLEPPAADEELDLQDLGTLEIFAAVKSRVKDAPDAVSAAPLVEQMKDALMQKGSASGPLLYDMNKIVTEAKKGGVNVGFLLTKIEEWEGRAG